MKNQYTPGPWEVYHTQHGMKWIGNADRVTAATVQASERQAADVALICAAPELLAALDGLFDYCRHNCEGMGSTGNRGRAEMAAARAAIAKAKGGAL